MLFLLPLSLLLFVTTNLIPSVAGQGTPLDYAPSINVQCPSESLLRVFTPQNQSLHPQEAAFVSSKDSQVLPGAWDAWVNASAIGYNSSSFGGKYSRLGIAVSGGGLRAAQYGAGVMSGLDSRNESAKAAGTGGLLQVTTYWAGLSGGSWLTGSLALNDWPTIHDLVYGGGNLNGWLLDINLVTPSGLDVFNTDNQDFYGSLVYSILAKTAKGFDVSITDPWSRAVSYHFLNGTSRDDFFSNTTAHGAGQLWSDITQVPSYRNFIAPFPIVVATSIPINSSISMPPPNQTVYEMTPLEFGSWDPNLSSMVNMSFAGTHLTNGLPENSAACVKGFDQAGFIMGTSASLFIDIIDQAQGVISGLDSADSKGLLFMLSELLKNVTTKYEDVAIWNNPFHSLKPDTFAESNSTFLELTDGGLNEENVPLGPLFVKSRGLDTIFAVDSSSQTNNTWPNGTSLIWTKSRVSTVLATSHQPFPPIPATADDFISMGANQRPTFFGCDPDSNPPSYPLVVYLPNSPPLTGENPASNTNTFKLAYTGVETQVFLDQVHNNTIGGFTPNSNSPDPNWGNCLQCVAVDRARFKQNVTARSSVCQQCFVQYCYDPEHPPSASALPNRKLVLVDPGSSQGVTSFLKQHEAALIGGLVGLVVFIAGLIGLLLWRKKRNAPRGEYHQVKLINGHDGGAGAYELPEHRQL